MTSWVVAPKVYTPKVNELIDLLEYKKLKNLGKMANRKKLYLAVNWNWKSHWLMIEIKYTTRTFNLCIPMNF